MSEYLRNLILVKKCKLSAQIFNSSKRFFIFRIILKKVKIEMENLLCNIVLF